jgi:hypothetical protein
MTHAHLVERSGVQQVSGLGVAVVGPAGIPLAVKRKAVSDGASRTEAIGTLRSPLRSPTNPFCAKLCALGMRGCVGLTLFVVPPCIDRFRTFPSPYLDDSDTILPGRSSFSMKGSSRRIYACC